MNNTTRFTFEVDRSKCFDALHAVDGDPSRLATAMVGAMMVGEFSLRDAIVMEVFGIKLVKIEPSAAVTA